MVAVLELATGYRLEYRWIGPRLEDAPTIVFLHEGLGCVGMWRDFPDRVASATGCGALVYSRIGYGASDPVGAPRPVRFMHDEALEVLPAVIEHFQLEEVSSSSATATARRSRSFTRARDCGPSVRSSWRLRMSSSSSSASNASRASRRSTRQRACESGSRAITGPTPTPCSRSGRTCGSGPSYCRGTSKSACTASRVRCWSCRAKTTITEP